MDASDAARRQRDVVMPHVQAMGLRTVLVVAERDGEAVACQGVVTAADRVLTALDAVRGAPRIGAGVRLDRLAPAAVGRVFPGVGLAELEVPTGPTRPIWITAVAPGRRERLVRYLRRRDGGLMERVLRTGARVREDEAAFELRCGGHPMPLGTPLFHRLGSLVGLVVARSGPERVVVARALCTSSHWAGAPGSPILDALARREGRDDGDEVAAAQRARVVAPGAGDADAWLALGEAKLRAGDGRAALEAADRAARIAPWRADVWELQGRARLALGEHELARRTFEVALRLDPADDRAWCGLGLAAACLADAPALLRAVERLEAMGSPRVRVLYSCLPPGMRPHGHADP